MAISPSVMFGKVMHQRLFPQTNGFIYNIYYLAFPLSQLNSLALPVNRFAPISFYSRDHAARDGSSLELWARDILHKHKVPQADGDIVLVTLPRVVGYVFNPVTFWFCLDKAGSTRAVICEVNNTFGETHAYIAVHPDRRVIQNNDVLKGEKVFHVSPFMPREGHYSFQFQLGDERCGIRINYHDKSGEKQLVTALSGEFEPLGKKALRKAFWGHPLITFRATLLIHWQALKLLAKGCKFFTKPKQKKSRVTETGNMTKM